MDVLMPPPWLLGAEGDATDPTDSASCADGLTVTLVASLDLPVTGPDTGPVHVPVAGPELAKFAIFGAVVRRCGPHLIEATVVPAVLFYVCLVWFGLGAAYFAPLAWTYGALARRLLRHHAVPPILILGIIGITVRTIVAALSHSSFIYFLQPILGTVAMGCVFLISVVVGRPLIGSLANEFWPVPEDVASRPRVRRLFRNLTLMWAGINLATAAVTLGLLVTLPLGAFLALKQILGLSITVGAVFITISFSLRTARHEGLAPSS